MQGVALAQKHPSLSLCSSWQTLFYQSNLLLKIGSSGVKPIYLNLIH
jgi:hypothetical protein